MFGKTKEEKRFNPEVYITENIVKSNNFAFVTLGNTESSEEELEVFEKMKRWGYELICMDCDNRYNTKHIFKRVT